MINDPMTNIKQSIKLSAFTTEVTEKKLFLSVGEVPTDKNLLP